MTSRSSLRPPACRCRRAGGACSRASPRGGSSAARPRTVACISLEFAQRLTDAKPEDLVGKEITLAYASSGNGGPGEPVVPAIPGMPALPGGLNIQRTEKQFRIVGIVERQAGPSPMAALFAAVMIPLAKAREMGSYDFSSPQALLRQLSDKRTYATVTVKVVRAQDTEEVEKKIRTMGFTAFSIADVLQGQKTRLHPAGSAARPRRLHRPHGRLARHRQHDGDVDPRADARDRRS